MMLALVRELRREQSSAERGAGSCCQVYGRAASRCCSSMCRNW